MTVTPSKSAGFTVLELLLASTILTLLLLVVLAMYRQGAVLHANVAAKTQIQGNARLGTERLERDLRMVGFGVPSGTRIGGSDAWAPVIFHATNAAIGFRADIDGGMAQIVCTPKSSNVDCPLSKFRLDRVGYHESLGCSTPDGGGALELVASLEGDSWLPFECSAVDTTDNSVSVSPAIDDDVFKGSGSHLTSIEQIYYRFIAGTTPPYGRLERQIRYGNTPSNTFPPSATWTTVADHVIDFALEYRDGSGALLVGSPLTASQRASVGSIRLSIEAFDLAGGPHDGSQTFRLQSLVLLRNPL